MAAHDLPSTWPATPGLLSGRLALVTGAASGIGRAIATAYAQAGARVVVTDLSSDRCAETLAAVRAAGVEGWAYALDVSDARPASRWPRRCTTPRATSARWSTTPA